MQISESISCREVYHTFHFYSHTRSRLSYHLRVHTWAIVYFSYVSHLALSLCAVSLLGLGSTVHHNSLKAGVPRPIWPTSKMKRHEAGSENRVLSGDSGEYIGLSSS